MDAEGQPSGGDRVQAAKATGKEAYEQVRQGAAGAGASAARARSWWWVEPFWPRAGWAITGLAGAVVGALVVSVALGDNYPAAAADWQKRGTAFTDRVADWSEE